MRKFEGMKKLLSALLVLSMVLSYVPTAAFAAAEDGLCEHHSVHEDCAYEAPYACTHQCTEVCKTREQVNCLHDHEAVGCTYTEPDPGADCTHDCADGTCAYDPGQEAVDCTCGAQPEHAENCGSIIAGNEFFCDCEMVTNHSSDCAPREYIAPTPCDHRHEEAVCGYREAVDGGWSCGHACTLDSGCVTLVCGHSCVEGECWSEGTACGYVCEICNGDEDPACTCEEKCAQGAVNAGCEVCSAEGADLTCCAGEEEDPICVCETKCGSETVNIQCPVCGKEGADLTACTGEEPEETLLITQWEWVDEYMVVDTKYQDVTIAGVSEDNPISWDILVAMLPSYIKATVDGEQVELPVTWECDSFPLGDVTGGEYTFKAILPEGYALENGETELSLSVTLGTADLYADPVLNADGYYELHTKGHLDWFRNKVNDGDTDINAILMEDITYNADVIVNGALTSDTGSLTSWTPIGNYKTPYTGTFDGNNKKISGLYVASGSYIGLIGHLSGGTVKNVTIDCSYFSGSRNVGAVVGYNSGTGSVITNCHNASCIIIGSGYYVGGILGGGDHTTSPITITNCSNRGSVTGAQHYVGGIAGSVRVTTGQSAEISGCTNYGTVTNTSKSRNQGTGGILGCAESYGTGTVTVSNCVNEGSVTIAAGGKVDDLGGVVGQTSVRGTGSVTVTKCSNTAQISGYGFVGGIVGGNSGGTVTECSNHNLVTGTESAVGGIAGSNSGKIDSCSNHGSVSSQYAVGGIAGSGSGISNCQNYGSVTGTSESGGTGGVVGNSGEGEVKSCRNEGAVTGVKYVGGVVGYVFFPTNYTNCSNSGKVEGTSYSIGGIAGYLSVGSITGCYNTGNVTSTGTYTGDHGVGGIAGFANSPIASCHNTGAVTASKIDHVGGIVGYLANMTGSSVAKSYNTGSITGANYVGGVAGYMHGSVTVSDSYNTGSVAGTSYVGGLAGYMGSSQTVSTSYNVGTVSGSSNVGGVVGGDYKNPINSYFLDTCGATQNGTKLTAEQMTDDTDWATNFSGFDTTVWSKQTPNTADKSYLPKLDSHSPYLSIQRHEHTPVYTLSTDKATITVKCEGENCDLEDAEKLLGKMTISAPASTAYDGNPKNASLSFESWQLGEDAKPAVEDIAYTGTQDLTNVTGNEITASITLGTTTAEVRYTIAKADQEAPDAPTADEATLTSVTLNAVAAGQGETQYAKSTTQTAPETGWQTGLVFESLTPGTTYYFFARYGETDNYNPSPASEALEVSLTPCTVTLDLKGGILTEAGQTALENYENVTVNADGTISATVLKGMAVNVKLSGHATYLTKSGFTFQGVRDVTNNQSYTDLQNDIPVTITGNTSLELLWEEITYDITTVADNGTVTAKVGGAAVTKAAAGKTVTLEVSANSNYELVSLKYNDGEDHVLTAGEDGTYSFTMPAEAVTVTAQFRKTHSHNVCVDSGCDDHGSITWKAWESTSSLPTEAGSYYLTGDVTLTSQWKPSGETKLCLNGKKITLKSNISVGSGSDVTITDCSSEETGKLTGYLGYSSPVYINGGTFHLYAGSITGNSAASVGPGGGVQNQGGTFNMYGGTISNNSTTSGCGGGVYLLTSSNGSAIFNMYGGTITGNKAEMGGGVYSSGRFKMYGGSITGNTASESGGGLHNNAGSITVSGQVNISGNTGGNVYLCRGNKITVQTLQSGTSIGVTMAAGTGTFTSGGAAYAGSGYFTSDNPDYVVLADGSNLKLGLEPRTVTVTSNNADYGTASADVTSGEPGTVVTLTAEPVNGFRLKEWQVLSGGVTVTGNQFTIGSANVEIQAIFEKIPPQYTITWQVDGAEHDTTRQYAGDKLVLPESEPTKNGYTFAGWFTAETDGTQVDGSTVFNAADNSTVYYAQWKTTQYTITYILNGGTNAAANPSTYTIESGEVTLAEPTRESGTFTGWTWEGQTEPQKTVTIPTGSTGDKTYTANWEATQYTITYHLNGGTNAAANPGTYTTESGEITLAEPTREGYTFTGWTWEGQTEPQKTVTIPTGSTGDKTYTANWQGLPRTITWVIDDPINDDNDLSYEQTLRVGDSVEAYAPTIPQNYYGFRWNSTVPDTMPNEDITVDGVWTVRVTLLDPEGNNVTVGPGGVNNGRLNNAVCAVGEEIYLNYMSGYYQAHHTFCLVNEKDATEKYAPDMTGSTPIWPTITMRENMTFRGTFVPIEYTITFDTDGGTKIETIKAPYGTEVTAPQDPSKEGYTFTGWVDEDGNSTTVPSSMPSTNPTLKAAWSIIQYTIRYDLAGGRLQEGVSNPTSYTLASDDITLNAPVREGHTFLGWTWEGQTEPQQNVTIVRGTTGDKAYTANWKLNSYTITFDTKGGTAIDPITQDYGTAVTAPEDPTRTGYSFNGWDTIIPATMPAQNMTITASWTANSYDAVFDAGKGSWAGGDTTKTVPTTFGQAITAPADPERTGYSFTGWSPQVGSMTAEGMRFTATWSANSYDAVFDANGGAWADGDTTKTVSTTFGQAIAAPADPERLGYTFAGWDTAVGTMDDVNGKRFTAQWIANKDIAYLVEYYEMDTEGVYPAAATRTLPGVGETNTTAVVTPEIPTGFTLDKDRSILRGNVAPDGSLVLKVYLKRQQFTITFDTDGGSTVAAITQYYGTSVTAPEAPAKTGYSFGGWDTTVPATMPAQDMTIKATWTAKQYTITFDTVGGSEITAITQDYGTAIAVPGDPTKEGYTFAGWDKEIPATMPAQDVTVTAKWTVNQYTVTFDTAGGSEVKPITQDYGTAITAPGDPTREGYTFAGWDKEIPDTMPAQDATITAKWTVNQYTITFDTAGGSEVKPITQDYGTAITAPGDPTREGYTFAGWDKEIPDTMPAQNVTITAKWTVNQYTITFDTAGGNDIAAITQDYGTAITAPADPVKEGHTFMGWDKEIPATMPAQDVTIKAAYSINTYSISVPGEQSGYTLEASAAQVNWNGQVKLTFTLDSGYSKTDSFAVLVNGGEVTLDETGAYTITGIQENITVQVKGVEDTTAPSVTITLKDNWNQLWNGITFGQFFKDTQTFTITAADEGSGVDKIYYFLSNAEVTDVTAITGWTEYTGPAKLDPDQVIVIYAKATDKAGNTVYVNSDGIVIDSTAPVIKGIEDGGTYYGDTTVQVDDANLDSVTLDGKTVTSENGSFVIPADNGGHTVRVTDKAGNETVYTVTVYRIYTVTFVADGKTYSTVQVNHGADAVLPQVPAKPGHDQTAPKWDHSGKNITKDTTITAVYTPNSYTVTLPAQQSGYSLTADKESIKWHETVTFTLTLEEGYGKLEDFTVTVNGKAVQPDEQGSFAVSNVEEDLVVTVTGVADVTAPTASITVAENSWNTFLNSITFDLFFKQTQTVTITASDVGGGVDQVYYYLAAEALNLEGVKAIENWTLYEKAFSIDPENQYVIYVKAVDNAGNTVYVSSDGLVLDQTHPVISGVENKGVYYTTQKVTAADNRKLDQLALNGKTFDGTIPGDPAQETQHTVSAKDKAGNETSLQITMKPIESLRQGLPALDTLKLTDKEAIRSIKNTVVTIQTAQCANATDSEKQKLAAIVADCDALLLEIEKAEAVIALIEAMPDYKQTEPDHKSAIDAYDKAQSAYDALSDTGKRLVGSLNKLKLQFMEEALTDYRITSGSGSRWTRGSGKTLTFEANGYYASYGSYAPGAYGKFVSIEIDGVILERTHYTAKAGSTVAVLKASYLETLKTGRHTIRFNYIDGQTNTGYFRIVENNGNPFTADTFHPILWTGIAMTSLMCIAMLFLFKPRKKGRYER